MPTSSDLPSTPRVHERTARHRTWWLVGVLLSVHFLLAVGSKRNESTTSDEIAHLTAGVSYWLNNDYRLQPENGILPQRWAALPVAVSKPAFPELKDNPYWRVSDVWIVGHQFFYETGEDHFPRLMAGRAMIALFSVGTGLLVFLWARRLFGAPAGLVALGFFAFSPDFLAHGALVTSDACMAFFFLAATGAWWWHLHDGRARLWWLSALMFGFAFVAKYSAVLLIPVFGGLALLRALDPAPWQLGRFTFTTARSRLGAAIVSALGHGVMACVVIWACYGFRYSAFNPALPPADQFIRSWDFMEPGSGAARPFVHLARQLHLLPEAFLYGFAYVVNTTAARSAFLNGEYSMTGWRTFFLWTFLLKTPLAVLLGSLLAVVAAVRRWTLARTWTRQLYRGAPLFMLFLVYASASVATRLNIGHRHVLPLYPIIYIALGGLAAPAVGSLLRRVVIVGPLLLWNLGSVVGVAPHFLVYFNSVAGGPAQGWRHLVDSSVDWGQDLPGLQHWLASQPKDRPVYLSYFGTGEPAYYHLAVRRLPFANNFHFPRIYEKLEAGTYCVSATMLQHVYSPIRGADWTIALENEFQNLRHLEPFLEQYTRQSDRRAELERETPAERWQNAIGRFDDLRFARLCHYLRVRPPDHMIGYSILIYQLTAEEVAAATAGSLREWRSLIERTVVDSR